MHHVICIQEHRYTHSEDIIYHDTGNVWTLATASAWKNSPNATIGGVGGLIGPQALKSIDSIEKSTVKAKLEATSQEQRIQLWKQHFENLLGTLRKLHMNQSRESSVNN